MGGTRTFLQGLFLPCLIIPEKKPKFFVYHINMYTNINSLQLEEFEFGGLLEVSIVWVDDYFILIMIFAFSLIKFLNVEKLHGQYFLKIYLDQNLI